MLVAHGAEILSTGGTAQAIRDAGIPVKDVAEHTGFPEILDGRVKTLLPQVHGGLLGRRDLPDHLAQMHQHAIAPIDLVAVNLYPFEATVARGAPFADVVENIDIGGPAMIRSAAKNFASVVVVTEPAQLLEVQAELAAGGTSIGLRRRLAQAAYARTAAYDAAISTWFARQNGEEFPQRLATAGLLRQTLRYGENPHQRAGFYTDGTQRPGIATAAQVQGKELSYNNLNDTDAAFECVAEFDQPAIVIVKHANPCGVATADSLAQAWDLALRCDPTSAFGGIVAANRVLDAAAAERITAIFTEVVVAPDADEAARAVFARKKNLRLLLTGALPDPAAPGMLLKSVAGGFLAQSRDTGRGRAIRPQGGDAAGADGAGNGGPAVRLPRLQACEVQRHRPCPGPGHGGHRRGADEPRRILPHRRLEVGGRRPCRRAGPAAGGGFRGGLRRLLPLRGRAGNGGRGRGHRGDPAGRVDARCGSGRGGGQGRARHGLHGDAALPALILRLTAPGPRGGHRADPAPRHGPPPHGSRPMDRLLDGYRRFRAETWPEARARFEELASRGQRPHTLVIACSDSRVDPAVIFGAGPGELFVIRNVANLVPPFRPDSEYHGTSAALEFGVRVLQVSQILVMGHAMCGGINALLNGAPPEARDFLPSWMRIAADARRRVLECTPVEEAQEACELEAVRLSLANLRSFPWVAEAEAEGRLALHGAHFAVVTGRLMVLGAAGEFAQA
jgi:AICAR transformylase/IMP cyclohydrolase PurH/carbonic anhydrase